MQALDRHHQPHHQSHPRQAPSAPPAVDRPCRPSTGTISPTRTHRARPAHTSRTFPAPPSKRLCGCLRGSPSSRVFFSLNRPRNRPLFPPPAQVGGQSLPPWPRRAARTRGRCAPYAFQIAVGFRMECSAGRALPAPGRTKRADKTRAEVSSLAGATFFRR